MSMRLGFPQITKIGYICSQTFGKMFTKAEGDKISPLRRHVLRWDQP